MLLLDKRESAQRAAGAQAFVSVLGVTRTPGRRPRD